MKRTAAHLTAGILLTVILVVGAASAAATRQIAPLRFLLINGQTEHACTKPIPDAWHVAVWVHSNGTDLHAAKSNGNVLYYAGHGTLVRLRTVPHGGPVCVRAISWLSHTHVSVAFRVL